MKFETPEHWHPQASAFLRDCLGSRVSICVACSGGADSVTLLSQVCEVFKDTSISIHVLHFNHNTRGQYSDEDAAFVRKLASIWDVNFHGGKRVEDSHADEGSLRKARISFFHQTMADIGSRILLTGHHRGDVAETLIMRVMRGSGLSGLCAPRPIHSVGGVTHVRVLLNHTKQSLIDYLTSKALDWREDTSNAQNLYLRNRIRHEVMPALEAVDSRSFESGAARARKLIEEADDALTQWADRVAPDVSDHECLGAHILQNVPVAVARRIFENWLVGRGVRAILEATLFDHALESLLAGNFFTYTICPDQSLHYENQLLSLKFIGEIKNQWSSACLGENFCVYLPDGSQVRAERIEVDSALLGTILSGKIDCQKEAYLAVEGAFCFVRSWRAGDRYQPLGAGGSSKVKKMFINRKIPLSQRGALPVFCKEDGAILWIPGFAPAEFFKIQSETKEALRLTYQSTSRKS